MTSIESIFDPARFEARWYRHWEELGLFTARPASGRPPFVMVIPPPNVTGRLHMGHALNNTLQDILARWHRMRGDDVLWLPGTDHAGIATQMVVDRELRRQGLSREQLGREAFVARVWEWKNTYGGAIIEQLKALGCSCDWSRERFTMEPALSQAVREAFVRLHEQGLVYRDRFIVNWCPRCRTAISDLEVIAQPVQGRLTTILYPFAEGAGGITVATTRPETLLGDTGVAVHPEDGRYSGLIGRKVQVPLTGRTVPIVADTFVDRDFGTGAVKVTPAHDPNDFALAQRTGLPSLLVMDEDARMNANAPERFRGRDRFEARDLVIEELRSAGLLVKIEDHPHQVGHCQRCGTIAEPILSMQWFVRVGPLAERAIAAVASGRVSFTPAHWINSYNEWMGKIHDWCVSRQLWWGHPIPAWHCGACGQVAVARDAPSVCPHCGQKALTPDPDVLDTWFSSALWPFSTLGWPDETTDLKRYYPTTALVTGFDILFFWVARMIMMGLWFRDEVPFRQVYITGLVRDAQGQKMSKTRGNVVEPMELIQRHGADAVRFTMAAMSTPGSDLPLSDDRMAGYRAFATKLWNAARFVLLNTAAQPDEKALPAVPRRADLGLHDRWILSRQARLIASVERSLEQFRFDEAANALYQFLWHEYCDWYLECSKPFLLPDAPPGPAATTRSVLLHVLETVLRLLHPVMPFLTEEIWQRLPHQGDTIATAPFPRPESGALDEDAERGMALLQEVVGRVRNLRAELGIDPGRRVRLLFDPHDPFAASVLRAQQPLLLALARLSEAQEMTRLESAGPAGRAVAAGVNLALPLEGLLDVEAERRRIAREIDKVARERQGHRRKLENPDFLSRARPEAVDKARGIDQELQEKLEHLERTLASLGSPPVS